MEQKVCVVKECSDADGFYFPVVIYDADEGESVSQNDLLLLSREKVCDFCPSFALPLIFVTCLLMLNEDSDIGQLSHSISCIYLLSYFQHS